MRVRQQFFHDVIVVDFSGELPPLLWAVELLVRLDLQRAIARTINDSNLLSGVCVFASDFSFYMRVFAFYDVINSFSSVATF